MGLFKRIGEIFSANLNDVVDRFEDPERMLKQAIREMEKEIGEATETTANALANEKLTEKQALEAVAEVTVWAQRAEQAVDAGDDEAARKALAHKREAEQLAGAARDQYTAAKDTSVSLRAQLEAMKEKYGEAKQKLGTLAARKRAADARRKRFEVDHSDTKAAADAFSKFDRMREKVELAEAQAEALAELHGQPSGAAPWNGDGANGSADGKDARVEAELASLKAKRRQPS